MKPLPSNPMEAIRNLGEKKRNPDGLSETDVKAIHPVYEFKPQKGKKEAIKVNFDALFVTHCHRMVENYQLNDVIRTLIGYFLRDPDFDKYGSVRNEGGGDLKKGLLIYGPVGIGKSMFFDILNSMNNELYQRFQRHAFGFTKISAPWFVNHFMQNAKDKKKTGIDLDYYQKHKLYIDDLGAEHLCFNSYELLGDILFERHRHNATTYVTTNLTPTEIGERYGDRVGDRLVQMFNVIRWEGESFRK